VDFFILNAPGATSLRKASKLFKDIVFVVFITCVPVSGRTLLSREACYSQSQNIDSILGF